MFSLSLSLSPLSHNTTGKVKYLFETPTAILRPTRYELPIGGSVTLSCSVQGSGNWTILWYKAASFGSKEEPMTEYEGKNAITVSQRGLYSCGGRSDSGRQTYNSDKAIIKDTREFSYLYLCYESYIYVIRPSFCLSVSNITLVKYDMEITRMTCA